MALKGKAGFLEHTKNKYAQLVEALGGRYGFSSSGSRQAHLLPDQLAQLESVLPGPLPQDYREFLTDFGGFSFDNVSFKLKIITDIRDGGTLDTFYGADTIMWLCTEGREQMRASGETYSVRLIPGIHLAKSIDEGIEEIDWPKELIPIACDPGGNQICLALAGLRPGAIFLWINAASCGYDNVYLVADSFDEFMHLLG